MICFGMMNVYIVAEIDGIHQGCGGICSYQYTRTVTLAGEREGRYVSCSYRVCR